MYEVENASDVDDVSWAGFGTDQGFPARRVAKDGPSFLARASIPPL